MSQSLKIHGAFPKKKKKKTTTIRVSVPCFEVHDIDFFFFFLLTNKYWVLVRHLPCIIEKTNFFLKKKRKHLWCCTSSNALQAQRSQNKCFLRWSQECLFQEYFVPQVLPYFVALPPIIFLHFPSFIFHLFIHAHLLSLHCCQLHHSYLFCLMLFQQQVVNMSLTLRRPSVGFHAWAPKQIDMETCHVSMAVQRSFRPIRNHTSQNMNLET